MKKRSKIVLICAVVLFVVLFAFRFVNELSSSSSDSVFGATLTNQNAVFSQSSSDIPYAKTRNYYESKRIELPQAGSANQVIDQKYERVATMSAASAQFEKDELLIRGIIEKYQAIVQQEDSTGLEGSRFFQLSIGVLPDNFEAMVSAFKGVGKLLSFNITKTDRTADYQALQAKRISLEKTLEGLKALRQANANLADLITLENNILEIEGQIQELGISLGDFGENNSFSTIHISITESSAPASSVNVLAAALDAFGWTVWTYCGVLVGLLLGALALLLCGIIIEKALAWKKALENARGKD